MYTSSVYISMHVRNELPRSLCDGLELLRISGKLLFPGTPKRQEERANDIYQCRLARFSKHPCQK